MHLSAGWEKLIFNHIKPLQGWKRQIYYTDNVIINGINDVKKNEDLQKKIAK